MKIFLDRTSGVPLWRQLRDALRRLVDEGTLAPGHELPASRVLAASLGVNRGTVTTAYDELTALGVLHRHVGRGTFVAARERTEGPAPRREPLVAPPRRIHWEDHLVRDPLRDRDALGVEVARWAARAGTISFSGGYPDEVGFPVDAFRRAMNAALRDDGRRLLQYGALGGHPEFLEWLRPFVLERGIAVAPDEVMALNGSQQAIDLVARLLVAPGSTVLVEDPTYHGALHVFRGAGARLVPVPIDSEGMDVAALERILDREKPSLLYTVPTFHVPTGLTLPLARRRRLLALAQRHDLPILEDDFEGELRYEGEDVPPLRALPEGRDVIYSGTFSKMLFPGIRLGWLVAPAPLVARLSAAKHATDISCSSVFQAAVVRFAREGRGLERHLAAVRSEYRRRRDALLRALEKEMPDGTTWTRPQGGFALAVRLPAPLDAAQLLPLAAARGVVYTPGRVFSASGEGAALRLSFGNLDPATIHEGVKRLAATVKDELRKARGPSRRLPSPAAPSV